jgi:hypothetical protein
MSKKIDKWRVVLTDCKKSGMPQREYCLTKNLSYSTFSYWRTKINKIDSPTDDETEAPFVRRTLPSMNSSTYILEWPDGMRLKIPSHLSRENVTDLINRLRAARS